MTDKESQDTGGRTMPESDRKDSRKDRLSNIGPKSAAWLRQVGIRTIEDVRAIGALAAYLKVKRAGFKPGLNVLYALIGAEREQPMNSLTPEEKAALVLEVAAFDEAQKQARKQIFEVRDVTAERTAQGPKHQRLRTARDSGGRRPQSPGETPRNDTRDARDPIGADESGSDSRDPI